jgi:hypothetical protein
LPLHLRKRFFHEEYIINTSKGTEWPSVLLTGPHENSLKMKVIRLWKPFSKIKPGWKRETLKTFLHDYKHPSENILEKTN